MDKPYNWRSARSRTQPATIEQAQEQGREPWLDNRGQIGGFKTRPGAPQSPRDQQNGLSIAGAIGTQEHADAWNQFFGKNLKLPQASSGASDIAADEAFGGGTNPAPAADPTTAAIANHSAWLGKNGVAFPPPPSPLSRNTAPSLSPMHFPDLATDPAWGKSRFITQGDSSYINNVQSFNKSLYAPADTQQGTMTAPASTWNRTGWNGPTAPVKAGSYVSPQYGTASVNFGGSVNSKPTLPASTKRWGSNHTA